MYKDFLLLPDLSGSAQQTCDALRDCFDVPDWAALLEEEEMDIDMDRKVSTITDYIN